MRVSPFPIKAGAFVSFFLAGANAAFALCATSPMSGDWVSVNGATRGLTRAEVDVGCCDQVQNGRPVCSPPDSVRLFGKCHPTDCDWGVRTGAFQTADGLRLTYRQSFATRTVRINSLANGNLRVRVFTDFADPRRADFNMTEIMRPE
ncbi:hypothetical protein [Methylocystis parvus]|uniref:hypothetical protein n=1 Tax=Methylocystis parvus TaxID=134 RepID=UPI003C74C4DC